MNEKELTETPEHTFDISAMPLTNKLVDVHQDGNFLVGTTEHGVKFRQRIPANKILVKVGEEYKLQDMRFDIK